MEVVAAARGRNDVRMYLNTLVAGLGAMHAAALGQIGDLNLYLSISQKALYPYKHLRTHAFYRWYRFDVGLVIKALGKLD